MKNPLYVIDNFCIDCQHRYFIHGEQNQNRGVVTELLEIAMEQTQDDSTKKEYGALKDICKEGDYDKNPSINQNLGMMLSQVPKQPETPRRTIN